jgi:ADP-ribose pyrophosphatase
MTTTPTPVETRWEGRFIAVRQQGTLGICLARARYPRRGDPGDRRRGRWPPRHPRRTISRAAEGPLPRASRRAGRRRRTAGEASEIAASRELEEETGYRAAHWRTVGEFYSSPGMVSESFTLLVANRLDESWRRRRGRWRGDRRPPRPAHRISPISSRRKRAEGCGIDVRVAMLLAGGLLAGLARSPTSRAKSASCKSGLPRSERQRRSRASRNPATKPPTCAQIATAPKAAAASESE